ncbi:MAG: hypothetical protein LQ340_003725 [Diploschistes diacapsis]|nr:MAG: hypothetical protein LQ340_003725 [Diploschistes diacapsis]
MSSSSRFFMTPFVIVFYSAVVAAALAANPAWVQCLPTPAIGDALGKRAGSCTSTAASAASASKNACSTIVLDNIAVPSDHLATFSGITLSGITDYGIVFEQDYENGSPTGTPTAGVPITDITVSNVKGSVASGAKEIYILCASGACSDWAWSDVSVTRSKKSTKCENVPTGAPC